MKRSTSAPSMDTNRSHQLLSLFRCKKRRTLFFPCRTTFSNASAEYPRHQLHPMPSNFSPFPRQVKCQRRPPWITSHLVIIHESMPSKYYYNRSKRKIFRCIETSMIPHVLRPLILVTILQ